MIDLVTKHGGWAGEVVDGDTNFVPLVVMPDTGIPAGIVTNFDIIERGRKMFEHLQPHVYPAGLITVSGVQLLEGFADFAKKIPSGPKHDRNMMKLVAGWRHAVISQGDRRCRSSCTAAASRCRSAIIFSATAAK